MTPSDALLHEAARLVRDRRWDEALAVAHRAASDPDVDHERLAFVRATAWCGMHQPARAAAVVHAAVDTGAWWSERTLTGPSLAGLGDQDGVDALVEECRRRHIEAVRTTRPGLVVEGIVDNEPRPLLVALHGRNHRPDDSDLDRPWLAAVERGWVVARPLSAYPVSSRARGWDDHARAAVQVADVVRALAADGTADPSRVVLAGFSQGADVAIRLALEGSMPCQAVVAAAPTGRDADDWARPSAVPISVVVGHEDPFRDKAVALAVLLGAPLTVVPGLGHDLPHDVTHLLPTTGR